MRSTSNSKEDIAVDATVAGASIPEAAHHRVRVEKQQPSSGDRLGDTAGA